MAMSEFDKKLGNSIFYARTVQIFAKKQLRTTDAKSGGL